VGSQAEAHNNTLSELKLARLRANAQAA